MREKNLFGVEVDKAVSSGLTLQWSGLVEQEIKLLHFAEFLQELDQVIPTKRETPREIHS